ncbi:MAG: helix-turn-helix transcriptional regulator [Candidatus Thermoplasmatota archaeon]|nr:helix-turn-helix transcriptional regulator [Candidatus Thermoplasmatota archaeon]
MQKRIPTELINYLILKAMEEGPSYGYELIKRLEEKSNDHWDPSYGTVYGALNRMEDNGFIERTEKENEDRKYYQLTDKGEKELREREEDIEEIGIQSQDMVLGFLNVYKDIFGERRFDELIEKIKEEFEI